ERELLRHVADLLPHALRAQPAALAGEAHDSRARLDQAAEHLDRGGLARAIGAEEAVDLAIAHLEVDILHGLEAPEALCEGPGADRHAAVGAGLVSVARKVGDGRIALEVAQD